MAEVTLFECDACGDRYGARNDVLDFELRWHPAGRPFEARSRSVVLCDLCLEDETDAPAPARIEYVGASEGEIVGAAAGEGYGDDERAPYRVRGNPAIADMEPVFRLVEANVAVLGGG